MDRSFPCSVPIRPVALLQLLVPPQHRRLQVRLDRDHRCFRRYSASRFRRILAKRGFKLVLIARNKAKLEALVSELSSSSSNQNIKYVVADFQYSHRNPEEFYKHLTAQLSEYEISGLINNVGVLDFTPLSEQKLDKIEDMLGINIYPQTLLSYFIIPQFLQRFKESKKRSLLINFSSTADIVVLPNLRCILQQKVCGVLE